MKNVLNFEEWLKTLPLPVQKNAETSMERGESYTYMAFCAGSALSMPKDHIIAQVVNNLRDVAIQFHDTQQLRSRIQDAIVPLLEKPDES